MEGFDRDALVATTEKKGGSPIFWVAVAALPVIGVAAGLWFAASPEKPQGLTIAEAAPVTETTAPQLRKTTERPAPEQRFSATAEIEKYAMTISTLRECSGGFGSYDRHMGQAIDTYARANGARVKELQVMANEEYDRRARASLEGLPDNEFEIVAGTMTGQLQRQVAKEMTSVAAEFGRYDRMNEGYLGTEPSKADCINFRNEVIMGKHHLRPPRG